jgi:hypothetical protein
VEKLRECREPYSVEFIEFWGTDAPMPTSKECWQQAEQCLELAKEAEDFYVKSALIELAQEFKKQAEKHT